MPRTHEIDVERHAVIIVGRGVVTESEMRSGAAALKSDPRLRPDMRILVDFAAVTSLELPTEATIRYAGKATPHVSNQTRLAIVAATELIYGLMRAYQAFSTAGQIEIFKERPAALKWLNEGHPPEKWLL